MIINKNMEKNLEELQDCVSSVVSYNALTDKQVENFLRKFEKARYGILDEIKRYNENEEIEQKIEMEY